MRKFLYFLIAFLSFLISDGAFMLYLWESQAGGDVNYSLRYILIMLVALGILFFAHFTISFGHERKRGERQIRGLSKLDRMAVLRTVAYLLFIVIYMALTTLRLNTMDNISDTTIHVLFVPSVLILIGMLYVFMNNESMYENWKVQDPKCRDAKVTNNADAYGMVVSEIGEIRGAQLIQGYGYGKLENGSDVYQYRDNRLLRKVNIQTAVIDSQNKMYLTVTEKTDVREFDVFSTVKKFVYKDADTPIVNPELSAYAGAFHSMRQKKGFLDHYSYYLAHGHFLVNGVRLEEKVPLRQKMYEALFGYDGNYGFVMVLAKGDPDNAVMAVYSDWDALTKSQVNLEPDKKYDALIMTFQDIVKILEPKRMGLVMNAFGPKDVYCDYKVIEGILNSEGYKKDFGTIHQDEE